MSEEEGPTESTGAGEVRSGEKGKAQVPGEDGVAFPREVTGGFLLPSPAVLTFSLHCFFRYHFTCESPVTL